MSIKKQYLKSKNMCKVTFQVSKEIGNSAGTAHLVGEFNNWDFLSIPMKKLKTGGFTTTVSLEKGKEYQFRYLLDNNNWENDTGADKFVLTPFGDCENSVVII